jgi:16S rRNA (guanine527-N7)-methyltransferase
MDKFVANVFRLIGVKLSPRQIKYFEEYESELIIWNEKFNLTAIRESEDIRIKHFLDSLTPYPEMLASTPERLVDVGTGAGFPGIPLKILFPNMQLTLVESVGKKAGFCRHIVDTLALENVEVLSTRVEELGQNPAYREKYDWAVGRAVASMPVLAEYLLPLVKIGGAMLALKGENAHAEAQSADKAFRVLGGSLRKAATPLQFPRRTGLAQKKPL